MILRSGSSGPAVVSLQSNLNKTGARLQVDGRFGPLTMAAVRVFQRQAKIAADGIVGPQTYAALSRALGTNVTPTSSSRVVPSGPGITPSFPVLPTNIPVGAKSRWGYWLGFGLFGVGVAAYLARKRS